MDVETQLVSRYLSSEAFGSHGANTPGILGTGIRDTRFAVDYL